jgi:hypothetical protein
MDSNGVPLAKTTLGSSCYPVSEVLGAGQMTRDPDIVTALFAESLARRNSYQVVFVPGPNFGDRAAPTAPMSVSYDELNAASFRMDFDTGFDAETGGSPGPGIALGPRLCQGFPVAGCAP